MNPQQPVDVFISRKSEDAHLAKPLYDFLKTKGLRVFDSDYSLPELGNADYQRAIDYALETCEHMIVVGSSVENICSSWVDAEWRLFINEKRAGYKPGNILTVVSTGMNIRHLPPTLRYYEVIYLEIQNFERIYAYVGRKNSLAGGEEKPLQTPIVDEQPKPPTAREIKDWFAKGEAFDKSQDYANAVLYYTKAAEQGHPVAQNNLGVCYSLGNSVPKNHTEAVKWLRKAAEQGLASAQNNIGNCYYTGQGVLQNYTEAVKWYHKSAEQGSESSQFSLGHCYEYGHGVERNKESARIWFTRAVASGNEEAKKRLKALGNDSFWGNLFS